MLSQWRKEYREEIIVVDKCKKVVGQKKPKKWQQFLAEEHQADIDSSKKSERHKSCKVTGFF